MSNEDKQSEKATEEKHQEDVDLRPEVRNHEESYQRSTECEQREQNK